MKMPDVRCVLVVCLLIFFSSAERVYATSLDLSQAEWGQGKHFKLDGLWTAYWGELLTPETLKDSLVSPTKFPVPSVWTTPDNSEAEPLPPLGYLTYTKSVKVPSHIETVYLYLPDMPSAYVLWVNGEKLAANGEVGYSEKEETPGFIPKTVEVTEPQGQIDIVLQLSNFHYREGGVWFSLKLTDESGVFSLRDRPLVFAIFAGAVLIALGIYNCLLFAFRSQEIAALNFGLLCSVVGLRRLLIDERIIYMFDIFSWSTLQRLEHICFYLTLPLFMGFFSALFPQNFRFSISRLSWYLIAPFLFICMTFSARVYTELNIAFQMLVLISVSAVIIIYSKELKEKGKKVAEFGISLLVLFIAVANDILKANDLIDTPNIAHFGVFAFIVSQSIAFQRRYLNSLSLVETMSSELKERNQELIRQDEFKDEVLANTSHELRTPLHGIAGLAKALRDQGEGLTIDQRNKVDLIANTSKRLGLLVNDILDFSSIKHNKLKLHMASVDLESIVNLVVKTVKPLLGDKDIKLSASVDRDVRFLRADEYRFQQILFNIAGNAVKFTESGFITLRAYYEDERLIIEVADSGVGIPTGKLDTLFRPFEQAHVEGELSAGGTGLGLSISKQLVELHGGQLSIQSTQGSGTKVIISFPESILESLNEPGEARTQALDLAASRTAETLSKEDNNAYLTPPDNKDSDGPIIYVVDDEVVNRELVVNQLQNLGYRIETFHDGLGVLERLSEQIPDLVLLDYMMPKMNGIEVCESIRRQFDSFEVPVMMLTARHQISDIVKALGAGANDYLVKPYHDKELLARVESQLNARKYWVTNKENQKLKNEIERREMLEDELFDTNTRLLNMLDLSEERVFLVNQDMRIMYANESAVNLSSETSGQSLLGSPFGQLADSAVTRVATEVLSAEGGEVESTSYFNSSTGLEETALIKKLFEKGRPYIVVLIHEKTKNRETKEVGALNGLIEELAHSRSKIDQIESAIKQYYSSPSKNETEQFESEGNESDLFSDGKETLVTLHRMTLNLWERHTNKGKAELAEASRCWRVYIDGTTVKTRTFDKYLSVKTVPDKPRWRPVVRTANFVLAQCELSEAERLDLVALVEKIEEAYS